MGRLDDGEALAGQLANAAQHAHGVAIVERRSGLVHDDGVRVLRQRPGDKHQLLLATGDSRRRAMRQAGYAHALESLPSALHLVGARNPKGARLRSGAHKHHVEHAVVIHGLVRLRNVGYRAGTLAHAHLAQVAPVDSDRAGIAVLKAEHAAKQRRLARSVGTQYVDQAAVWKVKVNVPQHVIGPLPTPRASASTRAI